MLETRSRLDNKIKIETVQSIQVLAISGKFKSRNELLICIGHEHINPHDLIMQGCLIRPITNWKI